MLSGIKFVPRDHLLPPNSDSDSKEDSRKRHRTKDKKKKEKRKNKKTKTEEFSSSDDASSDEKISSKSRRKKRNSSPSSSSSDDEGYEKRRKGKKKKSTSKLSDDGRREKEAARKEMGLEWMLNSGSSKRKDTNAAAEKIDDLQQQEDEEEPQHDEVTRMHPRELNPYFKDDGSGYPEEEPPSEASASRLLSSSVVGDGGASWRLKALKRAKEQAAREGRKLDKVVEERWGSLGHLAVSVAARRAAPAHAHLHAIKDRKRGQIDTPETVACDEIKSTEDVRAGKRDYLRDVSSRNPEMRKPKHDSLHWKKNRRQNISSEESSLISAAISGLNKFADDGSYMDSISRLQSNDPGVSNSSSRVIEEANDHRKDDLVPFKAKNSSEVSSVNMQGMSANQLAAKVLQLKMKGKHQEAEQLSREMEFMIDKPDTNSKMIRQETVGNTSRYAEKQISSELKKREEDADLHLARKIMQNKQYSMSGRADDEYDFDGDAPSKKRNRKREGMHEEKRSIPKRMLTQQERCQFCFENPSRPKHLVVSIGNFTYMMLPRWQPVVEGHCCILPMQHEPATRTVDKNVLEEIRNFKKCLLRMFAKQDKVVLFLETAIDLARQRRHCLIECIPVPYNVANQAPMYFKKAILEAEDEWGQHEMKKVIETNGNLRQKIPEQMSYFHVEFGLDKGYVHVIDDDANFTDSFGLNVIRGMLKLPAEDMHMRRRQESVEKQKRDVANFAKEWEPFDWTKDLE